ncbi:MAG: cytochrome b N-terminal domain-containing protein [Planctomycetaceae bacterium]|nr:cytochrome b N-terminal domain-containing protein [Planctomycetaceae bacterium]
MFRWLNDRTGAVTALKTFWYWTVPGTKCIFRMIPVMIIFAFVMQAITGVVMWAHYSPSSQTAWESVYFFQFHIPYGWLIRGLHHYSAQLTVGLLGFYILASILRYSYRSPREFVFWGAIILFLISLCGCLTGDLLSWSLSGYSATLVRVRFLQMIPVVGDSLFKLVLGGPGPGFGTYTLTRFLVLHIMVFGGGFFAFLVLWRFFDFRARRLQIAQNAADAAFLTSLQVPPEIVQKKTAQPKLAYFWSGQAFFAAIACFIFLAAALGLVFQHEVGHRFQQMVQKEADKEAAMEAGTENAVTGFTLPVEAFRGARLTSPADPATPYDAARPEWSFRALYHFSNMFPADMKFHSIFVIPPVILCFFLLIPIVGRIKLLHYVFNLPVTLVLFGAFLWMTYASYYHDLTNPDFLAAVNDADELTARTLELVSRPEGIPPAGALSLLQNDAKVQGRALFIRHCATCHAFSPQEGTEADPDMKPYLHPQSADWTATAPNLYLPKKKHWIAGFLDKKRITSNDYFGGTAFRSGSMVGYVKDTLPETMGVINDVIREESGKDEKTYDFKSAEEALDRLVDLLVEEAKLDKPREMAGDLPKGIDEKRYELFTEFGCDETGCHKFYGKGKIGQAPDLTGYMSREWLIGVIANSSAPAHYGTKNDRMPVYYVPGQAGSTLTQQEVEMLADWLRGHWYRAMIEENPVKEAPIKEDAVKKDSVKTAPVKEDSAKTDNEKEEPIEEKRP